MAEGQPTCTRRKRKPHTIGACLCQSDTKFVPFQRWSEQVADAVEARERLEAEVEELEAQLQMLEEESQLATRRNQLLQKMIRNMTEYNQISR